MYELLLELCKSKGISVTNLCLEITGSRGNLSTWKKGNINPASLVKIADYFNVSVDYLLGRTENPTLNMNNSIKTGDIGNHSANNWTVSSTQSDSVTDEFIQIFKELPFEDKAEFMHSAAQMKKKEE